MVFWIFIAAFYVLSILLALEKTYREQQRRGDNAPVRVVTGYLLCTVWPMVVAVMMIFHKPLKGQAAGFGQDG